MIVSHCRSEAETEGLGAEFGKKLKPNAVVCFFGNLGAGKTTFIKGLARGAAEIPQEQVSSPTFVYLNIYNGSQTIYHFDLYRLQDSDEFLNMGFDDYFYAGGISCVEWSEKIAPLLPENAVCVRIDFLSLQERKITIGNRNDALSF